MVQSANSPRAVAARIAHAFVAATAVKRQGRANSAVCACATSRTPDRAAEPRPTSGTRWWWVLVTEARAAKIVCRGKTQPTRTPTAGLGSATRVVRSKTFACPRQKPIPKQKRQHQRQSPRRPKLHPQQRTRPSAPTRAALAATPARAVD